MFFTAKREGDKRVDRRTCPDCGARSYSSSNGPDWDCAICGKNLGEVPNDQNLWSHLVKVLETMPVHETSTGRK